MFYITMKERIQREAMDIRTIPIILVNYKVNVFLEIYY